MSKRAEGTDNGSMDTRTGKALRLLCEQPLTTPYQVTGLSIKISPVDTLMTLKVVTAEGPQVAFVGAIDPPTVVRKAEAQLRKGELKFRPDEWALRKLAEAQENW